MAVGQIFNLERFREGLRIPTRTANVLAQMVGADVVEQHPGRLLVRLPGSEVRLEIRVRFVSVEDGARSFYRQRGLPIPYYLQLPPGDDDPE